MNRRGQLGALAACIVFMMAGCSSGSDRSSRAPDPPSAHFTGFFHGQYFVDGKRTKPPAGVTDPAATTPTSGSATGNGRNDKRGAEQTTTSRLGRDNIKVHVDEDVGWDCDRTNGASCKVPLIGVVILGTRSVAKAELQALENGIPTVVARRVISPIKAGTNILCPQPDCPFGGALLPYTISKSAKKVMFRVVLETTEGVPLATGDTDIYAL